MSDDYWYAAKPATALVQRQALSLEERGALITYEDNMYTRDGGAIPDERTQEGLDWHRTVLKLRDRRTIDRLVGKLIKTGKLVRLTDGRLTSEEVQRELAKRARRKKADGGHGSGGTGSPEVAQPRQLVLIEGGKGPQPDGDNSVDEPGTKNEMPSSRARVRPETAFLGRKTQRNQRPTGLIIQYKRSHEVVVAESRFRARDSPWAARPP